MANPGNTYLVLFGSGIAAGGAAITTATVHGQASTATYAGPSGMGNGTFPCPRNWLSPET